jgi:hypothetical protein
MAFLDHNGESEFPLSKDLVYAAMCKAIPTIKGMKIESADKLQGRLIVKAGVSLFSWGENIPIQLISVNENLTKVQITSSPKTGIMLGGAFDMGKNRKNIESILSSTSRILSSNDNNQTSKVNSINQSNNVQSNQNLNFMENQEKKQKPFYKKTWVIIVGVIILLIIIANLSGNKDSSTPASTSTTSTETPKAEETKTNWQYSEDADKMTNEKRYFASCVSLNEIEFEFPYNGGSNFTLTLRNMGKGNEIVLQVSKGQFMPSIMSSDYCRVKFDDGETSKYTYNSSADGSGDVIFLDNTPKFLSKLKKAKKLMIEAPFFNAGRQVINFDVAGLSWKK